MRNFGFGGRRERESERERERRLKTGSKLLCRHSEYFVKVAAQTWSTLLLCVAETVLSGQCVNCVTCTACIHQILPLKSNSYMVKEVHVVLE
jgi:hypothetical protein